MRFLSLYSLPWVVLDRTYQEMRFFVTLQPSLVVLSQNQPRNTFFGYHGPHGPYGALGPFGPDGPYGALGPKPGTLEKAWYFGKGLVL